MDLPEQALESVVKYLTAAGRQASHYAEALALLNTLQTTVSCEGWDAGAYFETATLEQVTACLEAGNVDLEARNASGLTPLHAAATHAEDPAVIQALLDAGAQVEATDTVSGATPLSLAIRDNGTPAIIEVLLAAGANPETPNTIGLTPLHLAALYADDPVVYEILLTVRSGLTTPNQVLEAAERSIEILIEAGADPTHLEQALDSVVRGLAAAGLDVANEATAQALMNRVQAAVRCTGWNTDAYFATATPEQVSACLVTGAVDLEARSASGVTPLQAAAVDADNPAVIEVLLAVGADPTATNSRVESGVLVEGDTVRSNGAYQDSYTFGLAKNVVVEVRSDDFDTYLIVESPSGSRFVNDDYQGNERWSRLALTLDEFGEYQVLVSSFSTGESGSYSLEIRADAPVHLAARYNENRAVIEAFLNAGINPNEKNEDGSTLLHAAARYNPNPAVIEALLAAGAKVAARTNDDLTPLHRAAGGNENPAVLEVLITAGANVREDDDNERTPLHYAASSNENSAVVEALIAAGANVREDDDNERTPLHYAASFNENPAVIEALVAAGANVREGDRFHNTPLHDAALFNKEPAVVEALLAAGADLEAIAIGYGIKRHTPLHKAASDGSPAVIETLLKAGADPMKKDDDDSTALHLAARYNENPATIGVLLSAGFGLEAQDDEERTPLHLAARYNENPAVVEALLTAGANLEARDEDGRTPLYRATDENENPAVREVLLRAGAGQTEDRLEADSGPGLFGAAIGILGGTAIATAGGGTDEAIEAGVDFAESVITGQPVGNSGGGGSPDVFGSAGNAGGTAGVGSCLIPDYPRPPGGVANLGFSWCPASVDFQVRALALQAAGAQCAMDTGSSSTPEQIQARRQEIKAACDRLAALGVSNCRCPPGFGGSGYSEDPSLIERDEEQREQRAKQQEEARQAAQRERQARQEEARQECLSLPGQTKSFNQSPNRVLGGAGGGKSVHPWRKWSTGLPACALYKAGKNACSYLRSE